MQIYSSLKSVRSDPLKEPFIVKGIVHKKLCDEALSEISQYLELFASNERFHGKNWHYEVDKQDSKFTAFLFNQLDALPKSTLPIIFEKIFDAYKSFGDDISGDFRSHLAQKIEGKTINPLVFWYPHGVAKFDWHKHPPTWQGFQLLINLTQPTVDYHGGHTHVDLGNGNI